MKVLVIDDDKFFRTLMESELRQENIDVRVTGDGEVGFQSVKEWKPDVIVLDLILPKKDGFELLAELRKTPEGEKATIFVFSGLSQEHDKKEALELGASAYFLKGEHTVNHIIQAITALRTS